MLDDAHTGPDQEECANTLSQNKGVQNNPTEWAQRLWDINDKEEELVNQLVAIQASLHRLQGQLLRDYEALEALWKEGGSAI